MKDAFRKKFINLLKDFNFSNDIQVFILSFGNGEIFGLQTRPFNVLATSFLCVDYRSVHLPFDCAWKSIRST